MPAIIAVAALALCGGAAKAQPAANNPAAVEGLPLPLDLPEAAFSGKPRFFLPPPMVAPPSGCAAAFDCRVRVIGAIQHNGAVELNAAVFKW
jgi:hypothetical protein